MTARLVHLLLIVSPLLASAQAQPLSFPFGGRYGQVEVGGRFAGVEFHGSRPLPSRISFYYPVANSIDLSRDYWKRGESQPMVIGVREGREKKRWIGKEGWSYTLSPHRVQFDNRIGVLEYRIAYEFCLDDPAIVFTLRIKNASRRSVPLEVYTHLKTVLRTCQTYAWKNDAWTEFDPARNALITNFDDSDAARASIFVENAGEIQQSWTTGAHEISVTDSGASAWLSLSGSLQGRVLPPSSKGVPVAAFLYRKVLRSGDSLRVVQIIGSCRRNELKGEMLRLATVWRDQVARYDAYVLGMARTEADFVTGDPWLDRSALWARALLAANKHYLDGQIVPMPCPAEYNFFFTHDLLLTDLGAVNFDCGRVKRDLLYLTAHSKDTIIPHAYYWRDSAFITEYCTPENWNHLWFVLATARYLRHSLDDSTGHVLFPLVRKSLEEILTQRKADNLMYAFRPDWWDIGRREGPRAYITILTIRALRDYLYISSFLHEQTAALPRYERLADDLERALTALLWDDSLKYLINYNGTMEDRHYYMGSLLAPVEGVVDREIAEQLVATARARLLRPHVGIMNVFPPDFHTDSMRAFFKFADNEAGDPYVYANGGVWPHANALYALSLIAIGRTDEALAFVRDVMTLDGVAGSPNGIPAMYEYRCADSASESFGRIDKPSFLWAAGFYLNVLYEISGFHDNEWNLSVRASLPAALDEIRCTYVAGAPRDVLLKGKANRLRSFLAGDRLLPSVVLPAELGTEHSFSVTYGKPSRPYLESVNAILESVSFQDQSGTLSFVVSSFPGHRVKAGIVTPRRVQRALVDGTEITGLKETVSADSLLDVELTFPGAEHQHVVIQF